MLKDSSESRYLIEKFTNFQEKQNLSLRIKCKRCSKYNESKSNLDKSCIECFLNIFEIEAKRNLKRILFDRNKELIIPLQIIKQLEEYFNETERIRKFCRKIDKKLKNCLYNDFNCLVNKEGKFLIENYNTKIFNPISLINKILNFQFVLSNKEGNNPQCNTCVKYIRDLVKRTKKLLIEIDLIQICSRNLNIKKEIKEEDIFNNYLFGHMGLPELENDTIEILNQTKTKPIDSYKIGFIPLFLGEIYNRKEEKEYFYQYKLIWKDKYNTKYLNGISRFVVENLIKYEMTDIHSLEYLLDFFHSKSKEIIKLNYTFNENEIESLSFYATLKFLHLEKIFPLLHDNSIEEIFLDAPNSYIYLNHRKFGRCRTDIFLSKSDIQRIKTLIRLYSGQRIDFKNPSIKYVLNNKYFNCRFSIDIKPIHPLDFALTIRKFNKDIFTIQDLIRNKTLNTKIASFLFFCIINRINITIIGETDSGKTTLVNALDLMTPKHFRKIYVENIIESLNQNSYGNHQLKYSVDSLNLSENIEFTKSAQIKRLLHRTPDLIYLGEILTKEEAKAMFHSLSAGLTGFQTIHAKDLQSFINRVIYHFSIEKSCLGDLGILILMRKGLDSSRKVVEISEVLYKSLEGNPTLKKIFFYDPKLDDWCKEIELFETETLKKIIRYEKLDFQMFKETIKFLLKIFRNLAKSDFLPVRELVFLFHRISHKIISGKPLVFESSANEKI